MRVIFAFLALAVVGILGVQMIQGGLADAGGEVEIDSETFTPDAGNATLLDNSNINEAYYAETVTVRDENGTVVSAGVDYRWNESSGTVTTLSGGELAGDSTATIDYAYQRPTDRQQSFAALLSTIPRVGGLMLLLAPILFLLVIVRGS
jgi:gamma-glutamylcyclotransferase (GGCT)/AIG2-like uncharacterized protein YtfP